MKKIWIWSKFCFLLLFVAFSCSGCFFTEKSQEKKSDESLHSVGTEKEILNPFEPEIKQINPFESAWKDFRDPVSNPFAADLLTVNTEKKITQVNNDVKLYKKDDINWFSIKTVSLSNAQDLFTLDEATVASLQQWNSFIDTESFPWLKFVFELTPLSELFTKDLLSQVYSDSFSDFVNSPYLTVRLEWKPEYYVFLDVDKFIENGKSCLQNGNDICNRFANLTWTLSNNLFQTLNNSTDLRDFEVSVSPIPVTTDGYFTIIVKARSCENNIYQLKIQSKDWTSEEQIWSLDASSDIGWGWTCHEDHYWESKPIEGKGVAGKWLLSIISEWEVLDNFEYEIKEVVEAPKITLTNMQDVVFDWSDVSEGYDSFSFDIYLDDQHFYKPSWTLKKATSTNLLGFKEFPNGTSLTDIPNGSNYKWTAVGLKNGNYSTIKKGFFDVNIANNNFQFTNTSWNQVCQGRRFYLIAWDYACYYDVETGEDKTMIACTNEKRFGKKWTSSAFVYARLTCENGNYLLGETDVCYEECSFLNNEQTWRQIVDANFKNCYTLEQCENLNNNHNWKIVVEYDPSSPINFEGYKLLTNSTINRTYTDQSFYVKFKGKSCEDNLYQLKIQSKNWTTEEQIWSLDKSSNSNWKWSCDNGVWMSDYHEAKWLAGDWLLSIISNEEILANHDYKILEIAEAQPITLKKSEIANFCLDWSELNYEANEINYDAIEFDNEDDMPNGYCDFSQIKQTTLCGNECEDFRNLEP